MSADVVNLRRARKAATRERREAEAAGNRARHGRTKGERATAVLETNRAARLLDGAKRDGPLERPAPAADGRADGD